nr:hypothetical protein [Tanacetum cinerariifolium]
ISTKGQIQSKTEQKRARNGKRRKVKSKPKSTESSGTKEDLKGITTQSRNAYQGRFEGYHLSLPKVVERETEVTKDTVPPTNNESTKDAQPLVVQIETPIPNSEPVVSPIITPVVAP